MNPRNETQEPGDAATAPRGRKPAVVSAAILGIALLIAALTLFTEPKAKREGAVKRTAMLVEVIEAERGDHRPVIDASGRVEAERDVVLRPQVSGRVVGMSEQFIPGGFVERGQTLLRLERADYEHRLAQRKSELKQAQADLAVEQGRSEAAAREYLASGRELPEEKQALVLRKPQLDAAAERVEAARAMVRQAELELARTVIRAPFAAHILRRDVNVGSQVSPSDSLARLVGQERYWVVIDLPVERLPHVSIPGVGGAEDGSLVRIRDRRSRPAGEAREGRLHSLIGSLDDKVRMARVIAVVEDPLLREQPDSKAPALILNAFVDVRIEGRLLENTVRLPRALLRDKDRVWIMDGDTLRIAQAEVAARDEGFVYIRAGVEAGDRIVTTDLSTPVPGAELRTAAGAPTDPGASAE